MEPVSAKVTFADLRGIVAYDGPPLTDEDIVGWVEEARAARGAAIGSEEIEP